MGYGRAALPTRPLETQSRRDRPTLDECTRIPAVGGLADGNASQFDDIEATALEGRAEFERHITEKRSLVDGDDDLVLSLTHD